MIPQHGSASNEHYTPAAIVEAARVTLGGIIDLDPASCAQANERIGARTFFDERGLDVPWAGTVFLNPPGGRAPKGCGTGSNAALWWGALAQRYQAGDVVAAVFVGFTLEILRSAQALDVPQPLDFPFCVPKKRIAFDTPDGPSSSPTHANAIIYLGPDVERFVEAFAPIGRCRT